MKKLFDWQVLLGILLVVMSAIVYYIHFLIFRDAHHIFIYLIGDIAFVFLEVLFVTMILHRLLVYREKRAILKKLNMVIGTFFSEVGTDLLKKCAVFDPDAEQITRGLVVTKDWSDKEFTRVQKQLKEHVGKIDSKRGSLEEIKNFLVGKDNSCWDYWKTLIS